MVKKGGRVVVGGRPAEDAALPLKRFVLDEIELIGSRAAPNCLPEVLALVQAGALRLRELVTHRFPLREFPAAPPPPPPPPPAPPPAPAPAPHSRGRFFPPPRHPAKGGRVAPAPPPPPPPRAGGAEGGGR